MLVRSAYQSSIWQQSSIYQSSNLPISSFPQHPSAIPWERQRGLIRVTAKLNGQRLAGAWRQTHAEVRRINGNGLPSHHDARDLVLAVTTALDYRVSILERMRIDERQRDAFGRNFLHEGGDVLGQPGAVPVRIEVAHLSV